MALMLFLVARLAARLIHPQAACFAVFACLTLRGIDYEAADARPYPLGMCIAATGLLFLVRWCDSLRWRDGLAFVVFAALLWRVHLLFWPVYLVFGAYAIARRRIQLRTVVLFALLGLSLVPVLFDAVALLHDAKAHAFAAPPGLRDLVSSLKLTLVAGCGAGAWILARWRRWQRSKELPVPARRGSHSRLVDLCPVAMFLFSRLTTSSVFVPRYVSISLPGAALAGSPWCAPGWIPPDRWRPLGLALGAGALLWLGQWHQLWPPHHNSDWRAAAGAVNKFAGAPVLCPSPYVEAQAPLWRADYRLPGFLYSHLAAYTDNRPAGVAAYSNYRAAADLLPQLTHGGRFLLYGWEPQTHFWRDWLAARPELSGWNAHRLGPFADVDVVLFERP